MKTKICLASIPNPTMGLNPYLHLLYQTQHSERLFVVDCPGLRFKWLLKNRCHLDFIHFHWPSFYYESDSAVQRWKRLILICSFILTARLFGIRVIWTLHNLYPHRRMPGRIDYVARWLFCRLVNHVFAHSEGAINLARKEFGCQFAASVVPHMTYKGAYPMPVEKYEARRRLGIEPDSRVFLHFGSIRPNKNVLELITSYLKVKGTEDLLLVAGSPENPDYFQRIERLCAGEAGVRLDMETVSDDQLPLYLCAADFGIVASEIISSGTLFLFLTYNLPIIIHERTLPEELRVYDMFITFSSLDGIAQAIERSKQIKFEHRDERDLLKNHDPLVVHKLFCERLTEV